MMSAVCFLLLKVLEDEEEAVPLCSHPVFVFGQNQAGMDGGTAARNELRISEPTPPSPPAPAVGCVCWRFMCF